MVLVLLARGQGLAEGWGEEEVEAGWGIARVPGEGENACVPVVGREFPMGWVLPATAWFALNVGLLWVEHRSGKRKAAFNDSICRER